MKTILLISLTSTILLAHLYAVDVKGMAQYQQDKWYRSTLKADERQQLLNSARINALDNYVSSFGTSKLKEYEKIRSIVESDLDRFVSNILILSETSDKETKSHQVVIRATIRENLFNQEFSKVSSVANVSEEDRSYLTFIFLSRKATSVKQYDDKVSKRVDSTNIEETTQSEIVTDSEIAVSAETYKSASVTTGGSTEIKADNISYDVSSSDDINTTVLQVFGDAGYEVVEAEMVADETGGLMNLDDFINDFSQGEDISASTRKNAAVGCRDLEIKFFAIGKLDIGQNIKDSVTGLTRVYVNVNAKVYDVSKRFPKTVASVGPVQYSGMGPTQDVAQRNALQQAGQKASNDLVSQMRSKNLY
jgi:hypothetical protein